MKFSVLIANFNNGKFIENAIESIFNQTYKNWEIIIVDDSSTDSSLDILSKYRQQSNIQVYVNDKNYGCGYSKHKAVELASGDLCGFLDPDDALFPAAMEKMVIAHQNHPNASIIASGNHLMDERMESILSTVLPHKFKTSYLEDGAGGICHFAVFKREKYMQTNGIDPKFKRAVDQDLYYKMEEVGDYEIIEEPLYYYRIHSGGISTNEKKYKAFAWHMLAIMDACKRRGVTFETNIHNYVLNHRYYLFGYDLEQRKKSIDYKVGSILLWPLRKIKRFFVK